MTFASSKGLAKQPQAVANEFWVGLDDPTDSLSQGVMRCAAAHGAPRRAVAIVEHHNELHTLDPSFRGARAPARPGYPLPLVKAAIPAGVS